MEFEVNYWAILVCGIANMVIGSVWYGPLFGKMWMAERKMDKPMAGWNPTATYIQAFIGALVTAYVFTHILQAFEADSIGMALQGAFWSWLGLILPVKYGDKLWNNASNKLVAIESSYHLVSLAVMGIILVSM